jgi:hypothetical protein
MNQNFANIVLGSRSDFEEFLYSLLGRMKHLGLSQKDLAIKVKKKQPWVSTELLKDPPKALARLLTYEPETLTLLSQTLKWPVNEMLFQSRLLRLVEPVPDLADTSYLVVDYFADARKLLRQLKGDEIPKGERLKRVIDTMLLERTINVGVTKYCLIRIEDASHFYIDRLVEEILPKKSVALVEIIDEETHLIDENIVLSFSEKEKVFLLGWYRDSKKSVYKNSNDDVVFHAPDLLTRPLVVLKSIVYLEVEELRNTRFEHFMNITKIKDIKDVMR